MGALQPEAEGSPAPVPSYDTFEQTVASHPTLSSHQAIRAVYTAIPIL